MQHNAQTPAIKQNAIQHTRPYREAEYPHSVDFRKTLTLSGHQFILTSVLRALQTANRACCTSRRYGVRHIQSCQRPFTSCVALEQGCSENVWFHTRENARSQHGRGLGGIDDLQSAAYHVQANLKSRIRPPAISAVMRSFGGRTLLSAKGRDLIARSDTSCASTNC